MSNHSGFKGGALKIASLNVRGFRNRKKRKGLLYIFKRDNYDAICLQDTHLTLRDRSLIEKEWVGHFHFSKGTNKQYGLLTLFNKKTVDENSKVLFLSNRILISSITINEVDFFIVNIYGPCISNEKIDFLETLEREIKNIYNHSSTENIIVCGDFNMVINNNLDIISGNPHNANIVQSFKDTMSNIQLNDSWRLLNGNIKRFSWSSDSPFTARRLD